MGWDERFRGCCRFHLKPASIIESILICFCSFSKYSRRIINERERDLYWALQESKDHREKRKSRVIREWRKVPAENIKDKNTNRWKRKKENPFRNILFFYMLVLMDWAETCVHLRDRQWTDADMTVQGPRPQHHPPIRGEEETGEEPKQAEGCMTNVFPVGGVIVRAVINTSQKGYHSRHTSCVVCFSSHPHWSSIHPLPVERRRQAAYRIQFILCGRSRSFTSCGWCHN